MKDPSASLDLRSLLRPLFEADPHIEVVLLFGSRARGNPGPHSDVDLAVLGPGADLLDLAAVASQRLGLEVDVLSLEDPPIPLLNAIVHEGKVLFERTPGAGVTWWTRTLVTLETDRPWYRRGRDAWLAHVAHHGILDR